MPLTYVPDELNGLSVERFYAALHAEGCAEVDRPGSTGPLNVLPLFRDPEPLFPHYRRLREVRYEPGQFPVAEAVHRHTLKLPVWQREDDMPLVERYIEAFSKIVENHEDLVEKRNG